MRRYLRLGTLLAGFVLMSTILAVTALATKPTVTLNVIVANQRRADWLNSHLAAFNQTQPVDVHLNIKLIWGQSYVQALSVMSASGTGYDLVQVNPALDYDRFARLGIWLPLDSFIKQDDYDTSIFFDTVLDTMRVDNRLYALPLDAHPGIAGLLYNTAAFDESGVAHPSDSWSYTTLTDAAKKLTKNSGDKDVPDRYGMRYPINSNFFTVMAGFGGRLVDSAVTRSMVADSNTLGAFQWLRDLATSGAATKKGSFTAGSYAMQFIGPWSINIPAYDKALKGDWDVASIPSGPAGQISGAAAWDGFGIPALSQHPKEAWALLKYMIGQGPIFDWSEAGGNPAGRKDVALDPRIMNLKGYKLFVDALGSGHFVLEPPNQFETLMYPYLTQIIAGTEAPKAAVQSLDSDIRHEVVRWNQTK